MFGNFVQYVIDPFVFPFFELVVFHVSHIGNFLLVLDFHFFPFEKSAVTYFVQHGRESPGEVEITPERQGEKVTEHGSPKVGDMAAGITRGDAQQINDCREQGEVNQFHRTDQEHVYLVVREIGTHGEHDGHDGRGGPDSP